MILLVVLRRALDESWRVVALILLMTPIAFPEFGGGHGKACTTEDDRAHEAGDTQLETTSSDHRLLSWKRGPREPEQDSPNGIHLKGGLSIWQGATWGRRVVERP